MGIRGDDKVGIGGNNKADIRRHNKAGIGGDNKAGIGEQDDEVDKGKRNNKGVVEPAARTCHTRARRLLRCACLLATRSNLSLLSHPRSP